MDFKKYIKDIPDFPKKGIIFKDISPLLANPEALREIIKNICDKYRKNPPDKIVGLDARGFIFGAIVAYELKTGFIMSRKPDKLPDKTISQKYSLEYGDNTFEIHSNSIKPGEKILILDDLLATGGSVGAVIKLVEKLGGEVIGIECIIELAFLKGREKLSKYSINSQIIYE